MRKEKPTKYLGAFVLLLSAVLAAFYWRWLTGEKSFYQSDLTYYFEPFSNFIAERFRSGHLPLWNPYLYCGMSQAAVPSPGPFYPPTALFVAMPFSQAVAAYMLLHQVVAGIGSFLLIISLGWGVFPAFIAGSAVALCGYMFSFSTNYTLTASIAWMPLLLYSLRMVNGSLSRDNIWRMLRAALCLFMMVGAGRPEISLPACLVVGAYIVLSGFNAYRQDRLIRPTILSSSLRVVSLVAGILLAAPVILPALEWVKLSPRAHGMDLKWVLLWSANWYDCLGLIFGQPLGDLTVLGCKYLNLAASRQNALPFLNSTYVGPLMFTLAVWGFSDRAWRWRWWVMALLAGVMLMCLGNNTPVAPFVCKLSPLFASFRYPVKLMIFPALALCLAGARGAYLAGDKQVSTKALWATLGLWMVVGLCGMVCVCWHDMCRYLLNVSWLHMKSFDISVLRGAQVEFGKSFLFGASLGLFVCGSYVALLSGKLNRQIFAQLMVGVLLGTMVFPAVANLQHGTVSDFYRRPIKLASEVAPAIAGTGAGKFSSRVQPLYFDPLTLGTTFLADQKIEYQAGYFLCARNLMLQNSNIDLHVPFAFGYEAAEVNSYKELYTDALAMSSQNRSHNPKLALSDAPLARFCQMTAVSTALTQSVRDNPKSDVARLDSRYFTLIKDDPSINVRTYRVNSVKPRAYFADNICWSTKFADFRKLLLDAHNEKLLSADYLECAPVAGVQSTADQYSINNGSDPAAKGKISFISDEPELVSLSVSTATKRLLVICDHYYPGWSCRIDGQLIPILLVNSFARGVVVPAGAHTIVFSYEPISVFAGFAITGVVLLLFVLALLFAGRTREGVEHNGRGGASPSTETQESRETLW